MDGFMAKPRLPGGKAMREYTAPGEKTLPADAHLVQPLLEHARNEAHARWEKAQTGLAEADATDAASG